jgi:hypothetical protein
MILTGLGGIILIEIYAAVMQREFQNTDNRVGKGFAILGIYLFVVCYCMSRLSSRRKEYLSSLTHRRWHAEQYHLALWC